MRDDEGEKLKEPVPLDMPLKVVLDMLMKLPCGVIHLAIVAFRLKALVRPCSVSSLRQKWRGVQAEGRRRWESSRRQR